MDQIRDNIYANQENIINRQESSYFRQACTERQGCVGHFVSLMAKCN